MTDEEIYQLIEDNKEETDAFYRKIHTQVEASIVKHAEIKKRRRKNLRMIFSTTVPALILVVVLAVVLPIVLQTEDDPSAPIRYYDDQMWDSEILDNTLHDFYNSLGANVLYLDWYATAEECITTRYFDKEDNNFTVYIEEFLVHEEGYFVQLSVMESNIVVESFESDWNNSIQIEKNGVTVTYMTQSMNKSVNAKFEYQGYKYYLELQQSTDENFLLSAIESMIPQQ